MTNYIKIKQMDIKIIKKEEQHIAEWSGGTTTQLYIFPEDSSYKDKTFDFRLSSANVDVEESTFTKLEGVSRDIMILEGELELTHKERYTKTLKQFDTDQFEGHWDTTSKGKVTDFNLMTTNNSNGYLYHIHLNKGEYNNIISDDQYNNIAIYSHKGDSKINILNKEYVLNENDFAIINVSNTCPDISIEAENSCDLIISKINSVL